MLHLFRKIRRSLLLNQSTSRYLLYAIGEILLVMIGILLALQVNNRNEFVKERKKEAKILREVGDNLEINLQRIEANIDRGQIDNEFSDVIISVIEQDIAYSDSLDRYFPLALNAVDEGIFLSFVGYESLKNAGFEIVLNERLRKEIITLFEDKYKILRARYDRTQWHGSTQLVEWINQNFYSKPGRDRRLTAPYDFDHLVENKQLMSWLIKLKEYRSWIAVVLLDCQKETENVLQLIEQELGDY